MKKWFSLFIFIILFLQPVCAEESDSEPAVSQTSIDMAAALEMITNEISDELARVKDANQISAESLAITGISGEKAEAVLNNKLDNVTHGHSSLIISPDNVVTGAAPSQYTSLIGLDLSYQPETRFANKQKSPVISNIFLLEEGFFGISMSYPIFSDNEDYIGYTDVTIRPEEFLRPVIVPFTEQTGYEIFILQPDGLTVYETNEVEIGKNILTDPLYDTPELRNLSNAVIDNERGTAQYTFWNKEWNKQVEREAMWNTLTQDHQEWRIGVVRNLNREDSTSVESETAEEKPEDLNASIVNMTIFVQNAAAYAKSAGQEKAGALFNNLSGPYVSGDQYIFAYDMNGTTLALPYQQGLIGKNRMDLADVNGLLIMPAMIDASQREGELMYYVYPNPDNGYQNQLKISRIEPVDSEWFIGSGIYLPWIITDINQDEIQVLIDRVKNAVRYAEQVGKEQAIRDFNDLNQSFADGGQYIFAYDYNGTTLALPYQPQEIGTNRIIYADIYGVPITAQEIDTAKRGGGFVYVVYYNPDTTKNELKLCYVLPAGDDWMVGSGIYTGTDLS